jgi:hypothetical protein
MNNQLSSLSTLSAYAPIWSPFDQFVEDGSIQLDFEKLVIDSDGDTLLENTMVGIVKAIEEMLDDE